MINIKWRFRALWLTPLTVIHLFSALSALKGQAATLQQQLETAVQEFTQGHFAAAYWQFEGMELDYGQEPEFLNRSFQNKLLPVRAYAALQADRPTDALIYFDELLRRYNPRPGVRAFALYNSAIAQSQTAALSAAAKTFQTFQETFPGSNEASLARLQQADLLAEIGDIDDAFELLDSFYRSEASQTLRMQARLRALQLAGTAEDSERARKILFETQWDVAAMPDIAVLSFAALSVGDLLLSKNLYSEAIRAYRLTLPRQLLIEKQRERLVATEQRLAQESTFSSSIWKSHSQQLIARLKRQLARLESMEDYTPGLYLRSGQAYLLANRHREATILFRSVATDLTFEKDIRAQAHYRWILALSEGEKWETARQTAQSFLSEHPAHPLANDALFLIARAYQSEGQYSLAIEVLDELIQNFPNAKQAPRWYFTRGYNYCVLEQHAQARGNFEFALQHFSKSTLLPQIELWQALTYFFEKNYTESLARLLALEKKSKKHPLDAEINYRIANVQYAQRDYTAALETANSLIKQYPDHHRCAEAQALRGDIYMGIGELSAAAYAFKQVPADDARIYDYAILQAAKIYKALERYDLLRAHLQAYVERDDAAERPRVSEAIYHIGWSLQQEERLEEAFETYERALERFGNDPAMYSVGSILAAYADLYRRNRSTERGSFESWLQTASTQSLNNNELTWYARMTLFSARQLAKNHSENLAEATLLSISRFVPIQQQDPETLAAVGLVLAKRGYSISDDYFEHLLTEYPARAERATAFYGKALLAASEQKLEAARRWLIRFLEETPTHSLAPEARLLAADVLTRQGLYDQAAATLNEILSIKQMRGRPHAQALAGLAKIETLLENPKRAIPYWQRIYTLYRAYPELIAPAYWESAQLFEQIGDAVAARNTIEEMLRDERLQENPLYRLATEKLPVLQARSEELSAFAATDETKLEVVP